MTNDDTTVGHLLSRREVIGLLGTAWFTGSTLNPGRAIAATHSCVIRPEQGEGPYFVDEHLNRSDIRSDPTDGELKPGVPLALTLLVSQINDGNCQPLAGAHVDIWHCDALGAYSDVRDPGSSTTGKKFLRGYQISDAGGKAAFLTVYPGWYQRRAVHIHIKIRTDPQSKSGFEFTSQLYFDEALTDRVHTADPYAAKGSNRVHNKDDRLFRRGGEQLMLAPVESAGGYAASFDVGLQLS